MAESPITPRGKDFAAWYQDVVLQGDMAEPAEIAKVSGSASTTLNAGELSPNSGLIDIEAGTLTGTGTLNGNLDVDNGGQFNPTGPVTIYGSYTQGQAAPSMSASADPTPARTSPRSR